MERNIGEIFNIDNEWYQVVKSNGECCKGCAFYEKGCKAKYADVGSCGTSREDWTQVIFKKLEKVGKPYLHYCPSGRIIYFQRYKIFNKSYSHNTEYIMCDFNEDGIVSIEIKQTKEDMEEKKPTNLDKNDEFGNVYTVYKHISPNGKEYVGMTRNIQKRWEGNGCSYTKNSEFRNDIMKYGWDNFQHIIIKDGLSLRKASKLEDELIVDAMNRGVAYNIARGGIGGSHPAWNKRIPLSDEQKAKLITANKGKKLSDETRERISKSNIGRIVSEETKRKIGDKNRGKKHSKEHTAKWKKSNKWRFRKIEIRKNEILVGTYDSIREASRKTGLSRGFINGTIRNPKGKHQGYTIIILD